MSIPGDEMKAVSEWLGAFSQALADKDGNAAAELFCDDGHWRDVLAFSWNLETFSGKTAIADQFNRSLDEVKPSAFRLAGGRTPPRRVTRAGVEAIEVLFEFTTSYGVGNGVVRLKPEPSDGVLRAWTLLTSLEQLHGHAEQFGAARAGGDAFKREFGGDNWQDLRNKARAYEDHEPAVLVVGGGQAGLGIAARLTHLGVDTLIVDRHERIGDNWRKRYHSLTLHNEVTVNHLPYMPFPPTWPIYIPKDMLANWFEAYVEAMELNYWTGMSLTTGSYDDEAGRWKITLQRPDGTERIVRPRHVVFATGVSAIPVQPDLPGLKDFAGTVMHSGSYTDGQAWRGRKALVVGTGNSAHDVAQDLQASGADVTMIQRASTHIVSLSEAQNVYAIYAEGPPIEDCDLLAISFPFPVLQQGYRLMTAASAEVDRELLDGLRARGFKLNDGVDDGGFQMSYLTRGGGYYFNVGCSDLIVEDKIKLMHFDEIDHFSPDGAKLNNGDTRPADLIVMATGYKNQQDTIRAYLGDDVADRIGPVWGFSEGGELRNMWRRTAQPGLWFTAGSLAQCRIFSRYLALQIKAIEEGIISG
jgi:putative flavoprotein involved in K+ transport